MDFSKLPLFSLISQRMGWLSDRHKVLAENVANADTPGYVARDLKPVDFAALANAATARLHQSVTDPRHLDASGGAARKPAEVKDKKAEATLSGNTVSIEQEMMKVADTAMDYQLITNLYRKQIGLIKTAIGRPQS
jgi:flagellar basal-body rod protein FlgB